MKKLLFKLTTLFVIFTMVGCSEDLSDFTSNQSDIDNVNTLQAFSEELAMNLDASFQTGKVRSENGKVYPDYYAGYYIENGKLTILVTEDTTNCKELLSVRTKSEDFLVKSSQHSYNELQRVLTVVKDFFLNKENDTFVNEITMEVVGVNEKNNTIFIRLRECIPDKIALFRRMVIDSPVLTFEEWNGPVVAQATLVPGGHVSLNLGGLPGGSIGYRAKKGNLVGIVTSGHVISQKGVNVYHNGIIVGKVVDSQTGGDIDAAFVSLNPGYEPTNSIGTMNISTSIEVMGEGGLVSLRGAKNNGSEGEVHARGIACNVKIESTGQIVKIDNCIECTYSSDGGDSGGLIFSTNRQNTVGIHEGADKLNIYSYYVLAHSINDAFGLKRY